MSQKAAARLLKSARALIEKPENWVKGTYSCHVEGRECYCMIGALDQSAYNNQDDDLYVGSPLHQTAANALLDALYDTDERSRHEELTIPDFNDRVSTAHADVLRVYDLAIANMEAE